MMCHLIMLAASDGEEWPNAVSDYDRIKKVIYRVPRLTMTVVTWSSGTQSRGRLILISRRAARLPGHPR